MLIDLRNDANGGQEVAETIVVGAGAVGLPMAVELARAGRRVTLLEAGGRGIEAESQSYFKTAQWRDRKLPGLHLGRFRALGGTTNFWGGRLLKFDPLVFEKRPWVTDVGWPITRRDLDPYYERGYELLGMGHHLSDDAVWKRLAVAPPALGDELELFFSAWAPEPNMAALFANEIASSRNLSVLVNAPVVALDLNEAGDRVSSVLVRTVAGSLRRFRAREVILANGTFEVARLLMLPTAGRRKAPWHSNKWLGKGFVDHIECFGGEVTPLDRRRFHDLFDNAYFDGIKYMPKLKLSAQLQREQKLFNVAAQFIFNSKIREHLANAKTLLRSLSRGRFDKQWLPDPRVLASILGVAFPMVVRYLRYRRMYNPADQGIHLHLISEQLPLPASAIHLGERCDPLGMPIVEIDWRVDGREIDSMATMGERAAHYLEKNQLAHVRLDSALVARDRAFLNRGDDSYHHMGLARMADTPAEGVVDSDLKVFGTRNLYVAGAAVYPSSGFANPTFTAIALGLRLAAAICTDRLDRELSWAR